MSQSLIGRFWPSFEDVTTPRHQPFTHPLVPPFQEVNPEFKGSFGNVLDTLGITPEEFQAMSLREFRAKFYTVFFDRELIVVLPGGGWTKDFLSSVDLFKSYRHEMKKLGFAEADVYTFKTPASVEM